MARISSVVLVAVDVFLRRLALPLVLLSAALLRYNLLSFVYLILFVVSLLLPGPRLRAQKVSFVVFQVILVVFSGVSALVQAFFQISLITDFSLTSCQGDESIWRQVGLIQFHRMPAVDVVRHLLPDVVVLLVGVATLCVSVAVLVAARRRRRRWESDLPPPDTQQDRALEDLSSPPGSDSAAPPPLLLHHRQPSSAPLQCYWRTPRAVGYLLELAIFVFLGLAGIAVPSLTSFTYYLSFLLLLVVWSVHLRLAALVRLLRVVVMLYAALHLLFLHLYQFQSAQTHIPILPYNTTQSLLARLFGLTPVVETDCSRPTQLQVFPGINYSVYLSPVFILLLYWVLATDFRLWLFTPRVLWRASAVYCLPVLTQEPSGSVVGVASPRGTSKHPTTFTTYGTIGDSQGSDQGAAPDSAPTPSPTTPDVQDDQLGDSPSPLPRRRRKITWEGLWEKAWHFVQTSWSLFMSVNYIFAIIAMMVWSVLYPSWPSLVLLLWACVIWIIPKVTPRQSLLYTSPLLVLYALLLLAVQYAYSLGLVEDELPRVNQSFVMECSGGLKPGCRSVVLFIKTLLAGVFFAAFHQLVSVVQGRLRSWRQPRAADDGRELTASGTEESRQKVYSLLQRLLSTYWVLAVVGAFLLVTLSGQPSLLKTVYLAFFFLFMVTYQVTERLWFFLSFPVWWLLVVYAALDLVLVYTYQFEVVRELWMRAYDQANFTRTNITAEDLFDSIGLRQYDTDRIQSLFVSLVPPAVFIAVMAVQLRYFRPQTLFSSQRDAATSSLSALDLTALLPRALRNAVIPTEEEEEEGEGEKGESNSPASEEGAAGSEGSSSRGTLKRSHSSASAIQPNPRLYSCYKLTMYTLHKTRQILVELIHLFWRFLELHLHKVVSLVLFAAAISQVSAAYWLLLLAAVVALPLPYLNPLTYPLISLYLGALATVKMVYQVPIVKESYLNFTSAPCNATPVEPTGGTVFNETYSPRVSDAAWLGMHKQDHFANYVALPIVSVLLLSLWFSARRFQAHYYRSKHITVEPWERGSLFLGVPRRLADQSLVAAGKYLVNHFYEMYGVEVSWCMLAIAVAVRIDVYGMVHGVLLGLLLLTPRRVVAPVWLLYLLLHGALLMLQYSFLLGLPPTLCFPASDDKVYPWSDIGSTHGNGSSMTALKKWFYITADDQQVLSKNLLYADFLVYLVVCLQMRYFCSNPVQQGDSEETNGTPHNFYHFHHWLDYFKMALFQYSFWVSLFLMFFTATTRVSVFGVFYLLLGFFFLYRGQEMLKDKQHVRHRWWSLLRAATWFVLFLRVSLQIIDCVFPENSSVVDSTLILIFNGACNKQPYYGSPDPSGDSIPASIGLWVDALNFIVITLQIIIFDTQYAETVRTELTSREDNSRFFRDVFDRKVEHQREEEKEMREREILELKERADALNVSEKKIDHLLYAGVRIPRNVKLRTPHRKRTPSEATLASSSTDDFGGLELSESIDDPKSKPQKDSLDSTASTKEESKIVVAMKKLYAIFLEFVDLTIDWLESGSQLYREVVEDLHQQSSSGSPDSLEIAPFLKSPETYGSTKQDSSAEPATSPQGAQVEVTVDIEDGGAGAPPEVGGSKQDDDEPEPKSKEARSHASPEERGVGFDMRGDVLIEELHIAPSGEQEQKIEEFEAELGEKAKKYAKRPRRLLYALYYGFLSHSEYIAYFLIILNAILNGSVLSMVYIFLLFVWGLLSIPWPTKRFWLTVIFYTMLVIVIKYSFQFYDISKAFENYDENDGLYPPRVLGILFRGKLFFANVVWDVLLLIALLLHRGLLKQSGLWSDNRRRKVSNFFKVTAKATKEFVVRLFDSDTTVQGAHDYYVIMLVFDILCFVTIVLGVSSFGIGIQNNDVVQVAQFITSNSIPLPFVIMLILQFLSMLADRAIYLRHSRSAKFIFHIFLLVVWHVWLFFILPSDRVTSLPFTSNVAAQCVYFFKCCYFIVSALQIVSGYPTRVLGYFLASKYTTVSWLAFLGYRLIPLLPELREIMDWVFTNTSLSLINWLKVQEIYAQLYIVKVQREREKGNPRDLGEKQSWVLKLFLGALLITALVLLIWGPLLVISLISSTNQPNPPVEIDIKLSLGGFQPLVEATLQQQSISPLEESEYNELRDIFKGSPAFPVFTNEFFREDFRRVLFPGESTALWSISPPARELLRQQLNHVTANGMSSEIALEFLWSIRRNPSDIASETVSGSTLRMLRNDTDYSTVTGFIDSLDNANITVNLPNLFPSIVFAPLKVASRNYSELSRYIDTSQSHSPNVSCEIFLTQLLESNTSQWWTLSQSSPHLLSDRTNVSNGSLEFILYSERTAQQVFGLIAGIGIIGLYVSVVLVVGRLIRGYISNLPSQLIVDEILNPDRLLKLCKDIFLVRESKEFRLEEMLVGKLFYIYRSPEKIVALTEDIKLKQE